MEIWLLILLILSGFILLMLAMFILLGSFWYNISLSPSALAKHLARSSTTKHYDKYLIDPSWWKKYKFELVHIVVDDGCTLYGHYLDQGGNRTAIVVHGYGGDYTDMGAYANIFVERGYNVLAVECRGHGISEGKIIGMGMLDSVDLVRWVDFVLERRPEARIVLFGTSMGATTVCMALGKDLPKNVVCAIEDCGFSSIYKQFYYISHRALGVFAKPSIFMFDLYLRRRHHYYLRRGDGVKALEKSNLPVMFIHGDSDTFVPTEMVYDLYNAVDKKKASLYIAKGAEHISSYAVDPTLYKKKVDSFLKKYDM